MLIGAVCVGDIGVGALLIVLGFLFTIKKPNNFGGMLKRLGAAVLIGGLFYGTAFYRIELYQPLASLPFTCYSYFLIWIQSLDHCELVILIIVKKVYAKINQDIEEGYNGDFKIKLS